VLPDADLRLTHASIGRIVACNRQEEECASYVVQYAFWYTPFVAGAMFVGSPVRIEISRDGVPEGLWFESVDVEVAGTTVAALDESEAERRFLELAQAQYPALDVSARTPGRVAYLVPLHQQPLLAEPVWFGEWIATSEDGPAGRSELASLSLSDAEAPLVPYPL
jgi:hypothetical protein